VAGNKVMVVHDDPSLVDEIRQALLSIGVEADVNGVLSAPRALGMMSSGDGPDVVIVDAELEGMDGYALTEQLKADPLGADVPVIVLSLAPTESSALRARQVGAAAHMPTTGPVADIAEKVASLLGASGPASTSGAVPAPEPFGGARAPMSELDAATADDVLASDLVEILDSGGAVSEPEIEYKPEPISLQEPLIDEGSPNGTPVDEELPMGSGVPQPLEPSASHAAQQPMPTGMPQVTMDTPPPPASDVPHIDDLLRLMIDRGGSDLHITVGSPPGIRQRGELIPIENQRPLMPRDTQEMILSLLSEEQRRRFETELELDFAYSIPGLSRFRANVLQQRNSMGAVFRVIPLQIPTLESLGLPKVCRYLAERPRGLVLVTGPTGSGKSTTLAAMIDHINETRALHIITMEDPIEFMHRNKKSYVNQREVGEDTHSFASALKRVLRQDPDVILVGEMRDLETISAAITAAETGHLVLATLHTTGGPATVDRIVDVFPPHQQQQVRMQLSGTLEGVLSQVLLRSTDGRSRVLAMEIMLGIPAIGNLIREGKTHQMATIIQGGASLGMQTLDQHLKVLLQAGKVTFEEAIGKAMNPRELAQMVGRKI
jgi:twitching motility protein PilT